MTGALVGGFRQAATAGLTLDVAGVLSTLAPKRRSAEAPKRRSAEAPKRRAA